MESIFVFFAVLFSSASVFANDATVPMIVLEANPTFAGEMAGYQIAAIIAGILMGIGIGTILAGFPGLLLGGAIGFSVALYNVGNSSCVYNVKDAHDVIHKVTLTEHKSRRCVDVGKTVYVPASYIKQSQPQQ